MDTLMQLVTKGNDFLWSFLLLVLLCGTGLYYTIRLRFIQVRKFGEGVRQVFGHFSMNGEKHEKGEMTPFQSIATAIAAQVGTGNLAGAATALIGGGPGAIFWMWISAFLGMATIYGEAVLAQTYKTEVNGEVTGGPVYYIKAAFKGTFGKALSTLFAVFIILALGFMGNMVQSNSIGAAFVEAFQVFHVELSPVIVGIVVAVIAAVIFLGGTKSLATVVEKIVPIMAGVYIVGSLILICMNITALPARSFPLLRVRLRRKQFSAQALESRCVRRSAMVLPVASSQTRQVWDPPRMPTRERRRNPHIIRGSVQWSACSSTHLSS